MQLNTANDVNSLIAQLIKYRDQLSSGDTAAQQPDVDFASVLAEQTAEPEVVVTQTVAIKEYASPSTNYLLADATSVGVGRPDLKEFMDATGASSWEASEAIYGVIGSNTDMRDWTKIMNSTDPLAASQFATRQLYDTHGTDIANAEPTPIASGDLVASSGPLSMVKDGDVNRIYMMDKDGNRVRDFGTTVGQMQRNSAAFGVSQSELMQLLGRV